MTDQQNRFAPTAFAAEFAAAGKDEWRAAAEAGLKGRPLDPVIAHRTLDGISVDAIVERAPPRVVAGRPAGERWIAMSRIDLADPEVANEQALEDLNNGASGLSIGFGAAGGAKGLMADTLDRFDAALDGVLLDLAPIHLDVLPFEGRMAAALAAALVERRGLDPADVKVLFGIDILRDLARTGALPKTWTELSHRTAGVLTALRRRGFTSPLLSIDARVFHSAGASDVQELSGAIASATEHVRALISAGVDLETAAGAISFVFACDAEQFSVIAKLRAARLLWAAWRRESGLGETPVHIHAETSRRMMTRRDPQTNMVRTTIAAFAAGVGGADSVTVLPYTTALGGADADGRRIARNAQAIILEESNSFRVADPAAGAGAIEALTDKLAESAWALFRQIERDGGFLEALVTGSWQERIGETRTARTTAIASRRTPIVGVSEFPQADERLLEVAAAVEVEPAPALKPLDVELGDDEAGFEAIVQAFLDGSSFADIRSAAKAAPSISAKPLDLGRLAAAFEDLRADNEAAESRPTVFLALIGPIAKHSARAGFVRNLLASGGLTAVDGPVAAAHDAIAEAYAASGARLAIACGSDEGYIEHGSPVVAALKAKGATVWLAGKPKEGREALHAAGVLRFVAGGDDAIQTLRDATAVATPVEDTRFGGAS